MDRSDCYGSLAIEAVFMLLKVKEIVFPHRRPVLLDKKFFRGQVLAQPLILNSKSQIMH
jgi:hypothetical protein